MTSHDTALTVECRTCPVRELQCGDCMVPVLLDLTASSVRVDRSPDAEERAVLTRLVRAGLIDSEVASRARATLEPAGRTLGSAEGGRAVG